ncbi:MAG: TolC family outer membrane protein [Pseudomonadota bacterium]|nr:TolC family outer membrane protein [Pseudomonadota bacterium]
MNISLARLFKMSALALPLALAYQSASAIELNQTVEDAVLHNPEFRSQLKELHSIRADLTGAEGSWYPTIDITAGIGYEEVDNTGDGLTRKETAIRITENLFEGFGTENEIDRQQHRMEASAYATEATANQIALDMTEAYLNLLTQQKLLGLAEENVETHSKILDQITQRFDAGIGNQVEVDQAKARFALAQSNLSAANNNYQDTLSRFQRVLGRQPDSALVEPTQALDIPKTVEEAINIALIEHPTLRSANADIAEAQSQYDASSRTFYPRIDLEVLKTWDDNLAGVEGKNEDFQAMIRMRYNLYNGGKDKAERSRTASALHQAAEIRNNSRRQTLENIRYAWNAYQYVGQQKQYVEEHMKLTLDTLTGYRQQFSLGRRSLLDLLNTEDEYINAQRTMAESENEYRIAQYRIMNGMGTLLQTMNIQLDPIQAVMND